jgi:hypothetical protein
VEEKDNPCSITRQEAEEENWETQKQKRIGDEKEKDNPCSITRQEAEEENWETQKQKRMGDEKEKEQGKGKRE